MHNSLRKKTHNYRNQHSAAAQFGADVKRADEQGLYLYERVRQLTLLGKTQPVTLKAKQFNCFQSPVLKREVCGGDFEATIDRTAFGVNYGVDWGFAKNVRLVIQVEAVKQ